MFWNNGKSERAALRAEHVMNNQTLKYSIKTNAEGRKLSSPATILKWTKKCVDVTGVDTLLKRMNRNGVLRIRVKREIKSHIIAFRPTVSANARINKAPNSQSLLPNSMYFVINTLSMEESDGIKLMMATAATGKAINCKNGPCTHCTNATG